LSEDLHTLAGAYAVDALPDDERAFFERHLEACEACRHEVDEFSATTASLGVAAAEVAPARLREQTLALADQTRQLPPEPAASAPERTPGRRMLGVAAVALAVAVIGVGALAVSLQLRVQELETAVAQPEGGSSVASVLVASDSHSVSMQASGEGTARFIYSAERNESMLVAEGLRKLPEGDVYQVWLHQDGEPTPVAIFDARDGQPVTKLVSGEVADASALAITVEPRPLDSEPSGVQVAHGEL
jgi:anti-sigma-K factor RskA